jgi:hypothetical protein
MSEWIIAVDPGKMCGLIVANERGEIIQHAELTPFETVSAVSSMTYGTPVRVVTERFVITPQTHKHTRQYDAIETIGALRYVCMRQDVPFEIQSRDAKNRVGDQTLRILGWFMRTPDGHANDAAKHCFAAFMRHHPQGDVVQRGLGSLLS